jgi:hypothetical protein
MLILIDGEIVSAKNMKMSDIIMLILFAMAMVGYIIGWLLFR